MDFREKHPYLYWEIPGLAVVVATCIAITIYEKSNTVIVLLFLSSLIEIILAPIIITAFKIAIRRAMSGKRKEKKHPYLYWELAGLTVGIVSFVFIAVCEDPSILLGFLLLASLAEIILAPIIIANFDCQLNNRLAEQRKRTEREYREKYITNVEIENERFGKLTFDKDSNKNTLRIAYGSALCIPFGKYDQVEIDIDVDENIINKAFEGLAYVYDNQEKILRDFYNYIKEICDEWNESDSNGNPIDIKYAEKYFSLHYIYVHSSINQEILVSLSGVLLDDFDSYCELLGYHLIEAEINCNTKEVSYGLEG